MYLFLCVCLVAVASCHGMAGGWELVDKHSPELKAIETFIAKNYSATINTDMTMQVMVAHKQIVNGANYNITFYLTVGEREYVCKVIVYDQPWTNTREITHDTCAGLHQNNKRSVASGAPTQIDINDDVKAAAAFAAERINEATNSMYISCLTAINNPTAQVVAGTMYTMEIVLKESRINKNAPGVSATNGCTTPAFSQIRGCHVKIWDEPWRTPRYMLQEHHCVGMMS